MDQSKSRGMKALTVALIAASALVLTVILVAFSGAARQSGNVYESTAEPETAATREPTADLGYEEPESTAEETTAEETTAEETTTEAPRELAFTSNGDGTCYVSGLGTYARSEVSIPTLAPSGEIVTGIGKYAFYNETRIVRISIPSTVKTVGEYAFLGCTALVEITVSQNNTALKVEDGLLVSSDGARIFCCPAMRGKTSCTLSADVSVIEGGAFANAKNLRTVYFCGSAADFIEISIEAHNELFESIRLVCNYTEK